MKILTLCLLLWCWTSNAFTEWWIQSSATNGNLNAGSTADNTPTFAVASGNWTNATGVWFKSGAVTAAVTNGAWASVFVDGTTTNTWFVGLVTNVDLVNNRVWISLKANAGTNPSDQVGTATIRVGGAWAGPNTNQNPSITFPWPFMAGSLTNAPMNNAWFNFKNDSIYAWTNAATLANASQVPFGISGYTSTARDGGMATNDGTCSLASYIPLTVSGKYITITDMMFGNNGTSGVSGGIVGSDGQVWRRIVVHDFRGNGLSIGASLADTIEAYNCNTGNSANTGGMKISSGTIANGNFHNNPFVAGFVIAGGRAERCFSYNNGGSGVVIPSPGSTSPSTLNGVECFSNHVAGVDMSSGTTPSIITLRNCNFLQNLSSAITSSGGSANTLIIDTCGFGSGTYTNAGGMFASTVSTYYTNNLITYTANTTPWVDPANGNFTPLSLGKAKGISQFMQVGVNSPTNTVSYPDLGAAQLASTNVAAGASGGAYTFAQ